VEKERSKKADHKRAQGQGPLSRGGEGTDYPQTVRGGGETTLVGGVWVECRREKHRACVESRKVKRGMDGIRRRRERKYKAKDQGN